MASEKITAIVEQLKALSLLEVKELKEALEEEFGVTAMAIGGGGGAAAEAAPVEEQTEFDVMLTSFGDKKLNVIKVVRTITGLGLADAKKLVESAPDAKLKEAVSKEEGEAIKAQIAEAGGTVELK